MNGIQLPIKPLCKALFKPGDSWSDSSPADFFAVEVDTHGMFNAASPAYLRIPVNGLYSVIANINFADSSVEAEWGIQVSPQPVWKAWDTASYLARCYTGFGAWNGMYAEALVNLYAGDHVWLTPRKPAYPTTMRNYTSTEQRASHMVIQYLRPNVPTRNANGTVYDYR